MRTPISLAAGIATLAALALPSAASASYSGAVLANSPVAFYELNETAGTTAADTGTAGAAANGTYSNATLGVAAPFADAGTAVTLGTSGTIAATLPSGSSVQTIELWVNPSVRSGQSFVTYDGQWSVGIAPNGGAGVTPSMKRKLVLADAAGNRVNSKITLPAGAWTMVDVTLNASTNQIAFYVNGGAVAKSVTAPAGFTFPAAPSSATALTIGPGAGKNGTKIDEVALYPTVLTQQQLQSHFSASPLPDLATAPTLSPLTGIDVGATLTFTQGTYNGTGITLSDTWYRCNDAVTDPSVSPCAAIATVSGGNSTYKLQAADAGFTIMVEETATNAAGSIVTDTPETDAVGTPTTSTNPPPPGDGGNPPVVIGASGAAPAPAPGGGTTSGTTGSSNSCVAHFASVKARTARVGKRSLRLSFASKTRTLKLTAPKRSVASVTYKLDGKRLRASKKAPYKAVVSLKGLRTGHHTLKAVVKLRAGKARTLTLRLSLKGC